jgi:hypothetical protein
MKIKWFKSTVKEMIAQPNFDAAAALDGSM